MLKAFADCSRASTGRPSDTIVLVPEGDFSIASNVHFLKAQGLTFTFNGQLHLVYNPKLSGNIISFLSCQNLIVNGHGRFNGNGDLYRPNGNLHLLPHRPRLVRFQRCANVDYSGFDLHDSPKFHLVVDRGNNFKVHDFHIKSTDIGETDGVDISGVDNHVYNVVVEAGDECVTAKNPTNGLLVENITCINTDGCAIGSMGPSAKGYLIENILYRNVSVRNASNGVTIKSYTTAQGTIRNVTYKHFKVQDVAYPIKLDHGWGETLKNHIKRNQIASCGGNTGQQWSDINFIDFEGTGTRSRALVTLNCPQNHPCTGLNFQQIQITGSAKENVIVSACGTWDMISEPLLKNLPEC